MGPPPASAVGVALPISRTLAQERELVGRIEAVDSVELNARTTGFIATIAVADGAEVAAGQVIARLDPTPFDAAIALGEARIAAALAREQQAQARLKRRAPLVQQQVITDQDLEDDRAVAAAAVAETAAARAELVQARLEREWADIKAPFAGRLGHIGVSIGTLAKAVGGPEPTRIAILVSTDPIEVVCDLEEQIWRAHVAHLVAGAPVAVGLPGEAGFPHQGTLLAVDNRIEPGAGTIRIRARLPNAQRTLVPGAFARVRLSLSAPRPVVLVHEHALQPAPQGQMVMLADAENKTAPRPVQVGDRVGALRIVTGISPADRVIVVGQAKINGPPGTAVNPYLVDMETLASPAPAAPAAADAAKAAP